MNIEFRLRNFKDLFPIMLIYSLTQGIISKMVFKILNWKEPNHSKKETSKTMQKIAGLASS